MSNSSDSVFARLLAPAEALINPAALQAKPMLASSRTVFHCKAFAKDMLQRATKGANIGSRTATPVDGDMTSEHAHSMIDVAHASQTRTCRVTTLLVQVPSTVLSCERPTTKNTAGCGAPLISNVYCTKAFIFVVVNCSIAFGFFILQNGPKQLVFLLRQNFENRKLATVSHRIARDR